MKRWFIILFAIALSAVAAGIITSNRLHARHAEQLAAREAEWQAEKARLQSAAKRTRTHTVVVPAEPAATSVPPATPDAGLTPADLIARLRNFKFGPEASQIRLTRQAIRDFEDLIAAGPAALPAIRQFLARNEDVDFDTANPKANRGAVPNDFLLAPSLRFGLFDVLKQIGGPDAEALLAEVLASTGRGVELAWLARALQEMAPNKYRDTALAAARELLARPLAANSPSPLDRNDRDQLFSVLTMYGDTSYVATAQAQLIQPDGVDRGALKYLQQTLGPQAVPIVAQAYSDPRLTDPAKKEPLARLALAYVGADAFANEFYQRAINDLSLSKDHRRNLIEDLNEDGLNFKNLTPRDLPVIENRITLIETIAPNATDRVNIEAFKEAYKDLLKMRERARER
ncbi:MAG: hypothetical protein AB1705_00635 [Verrucomicrobiota bacterium]